MRIFTFLAILIILCQVSLAQTNRETKNMELDSITVRIKSNWWNNPDEALKDIALGESIAQKYVPERVPEMIKYRGIVFYFKSEYALAEKFYNQALPLYRHYGDSSGVSSCLNNLAILNVEQGEYEIAIEKYMKVREIAEGNNDTLMISKVYLNLGNVYSQLHQINKALDSFLESLVFTDTLNNKVQYAILLNNLGGTYNDLDSLQLAYYYHSKALALRKDLGNKIHIGSSLSNVANIMTKMENYQDAIINYNLALEIFEETNYTKGFASAYVNLGNCYYQLEDYVSAGECYAKSIDFSNGIHSDFIQSLGYMNMASALYRAGYFQKSYDALLIHKNLTDSLRITDSQKLVAELDAKYQAQKKETEIQELKATELKQEKRIVVTTMWLLILAVLTLIVVIISIRIRYKQRVRNAQLDKKNLEMENQLLRVQMNPHFLFNSMTSIQYYMDKNPESASKYLAKFSRLTRLILEHSREQWVSLTEEIEAMELYLSIEQLRLENKFSWKLKIDDELEEDLLEIPPMMFQPFIENAIKHGILPKEGNGNIQIKIEMANNNRLKVTVQDDGVGRNKNSNNKKHHSLGTELTNERIALLEKQYNTQLKLEVIDLFDNGMPVGTKVEIEIPCQIN